MSFFTQNVEGDLVNSVRTLMEQRKPGEFLPKVIYRAAVLAGAEARGKSLEERRVIFTAGFNTSVMEEVSRNRRFMATNQTIMDFNEVATKFLSMSEDAEGAGSFEDVADDEGSPLEADDRGRLDQRKVQEDADEDDDSKDDDEDEDDDDMKEDASLSAQGTGVRVTSREPYLAAKRAAAAKKAAAAKAAAEKPAVKEDAEGAGSWEDVADDEGSPMSNEDRQRLELRKEAFKRLGEQGSLSNFGGKQAKPFTKKSAKKAVKEEDTTGTDNESEDIESDERTVSTQPETVRDIDNVPVSQTHSFANESWTMLVDPAGMSIGEQHLLAGKLAESKRITEARASCATDKSPFRVVVRAKNETEAVQRLVSAFEKAGSKLTEDNILVAHRTPLNERNLSTKERKALPKSDFAVPSKEPGSGSYPIPDKAHARNALARVAQHGSSGEKAAVRAKVAKRFPSVGK